MTGIPTDSDYFITLYTPHVHVNLFELKHNYPLLTLDSTHANLRCKPWLHHVIVVSGKISENRIRRLLCSEYQNMLNFLCWYFVLFYIAILQRRTLPICIRHSSNIIIIACNLSNKYDANQALEQLRAGRTVMSFIK